MMKVSPIIKLKKLVTDLLSENTKEYEMKLKNNVKLVMIGHQVL